MLEWLKRHVWKACDRPKRFQGSNPCLSANNLKLSAKHWAFFVQGRQELAPVRTCAEKAKGRKAKSFKLFVRAPAANTSLPPPNLALKPITREQINLFTHRRPIEDRFRE